jgi:hypothetical protein
MSTVMTSGQYFPPGNSFKSQNGRYTLIYQNDGNLVLYAGSQALWNSGTYGRSTSKAIMQTDGNLVVYDAGNRAVWSSGTWGNGGARLELQDDGNLVIYNTAGRALWNTGTYGGRTNVQPPQTQQFGGATLNPGGWITSPNGRYKLIYQNDGNLVLYAGSQALWNSATYGRSAGRAVMQPDGNLVVYDASNRAVWNSNTWGNPGARLALQDDGNLVIYDTSGRALWSSGTYGGRSTIQQPSNAPANSVQSLLGRWTSKTYQTTVDVTRLNDGTIYVSWYTGGGGGKLWQEGDRIWLQWPFTGAVAGKAWAPASSASSSQVVWTKENGAYEDTWSLVKR